MVCSIGSDVQYILCIWRKSSEDCHQGGDLKVAGIRQHTVDVLVLNYNLMSVRRRSCVVAQLEVDGDGGWCATVDTETRC